jgi:hypothetical protein
MCAENSILNPTNVAAFFSAIAGAFLGSLSAFGLGLFQQKRDLRDKQYNLLITTQAALWSQCNTLKGIKLNYLDRLREDNERFTKLGPLITPMSFCSVPFSEIVFIMTLGKPNLLLEIQVAEQNYICAMQALDLRNKMLDKSVCESNRLKEATDALYQQVDYTIPKLEQQVKNIYDFVKQNFKKTALEITPQAQ